MASLYSDASRPLIILVYNNNHYNSPANHEEAE
jgi:hypothetical protein